MLLKQLRERVNDLCLQDDYLNRYRDHLASEGFGQHPSGTSNHLRDTEDKYGKEGHSFSLNREIMYSYDICGSCEAHAIMFSIERGLASSVNNGLLMEKLTPSQRKDNVNFIKCP